MEWDRKNDKFILTRNEFEKILELLEKIEKFFFSKEYFELMEMKKKMKNLATEVLKIEDENERERLRKLIIEND